MKYEMKTLSSAVHLALILGAMAVATAPGAALAQDAQGEQSGSAGTQEAKQLQGIIVTGSLVRRVDLETANPVVTVDSAAIAATGKVTVGDLMQDLPAMTGANTNPQVNNGGGKGESTLSLRGLGEKRSLILVDGHRVVSQDLNSIPTNMIERVDLLTTGASAIYGSDAIGGVVNFITRKEYQGAQFTVDYGKSGHNDGTTKSYTFTFGQTSDKGSIMGGVGYSKMEPVLSADRDYTKQTISVTGSPTKPINKFVGGSTSSPFGNIQLPPDLKASFPGCASGNLARNVGSNGMDPVADYHCYQNSGPNTDKYDYAPVNFIMTPQERTNLFLLGSYNLTDNVTAYLNGYYNKTSSAFQLAPSVYLSSQGVAIAADNYWNPFGVEFSPSAYRFGARLASLGPRSAAYGTAVNQFSSGIKGHFTVFDRDWQWDVGMDYGHISQVTTTMGLPNNDKLYTGPSFLDAATGLVTCGVPGAPVSGCDASFNPFVLEAPNSVAALRAASPPAISNEYRQQKTWRADVNGSLFDLPAGTVQLAVGASYRQEHMVSVVDPMLDIDPATGTCMLSSQCSASLRGGFNVKEVYAEAFIPILSDIPGIHSLNATIGDRYSRFSSFGNTNNKKFALEWKPIEDLLIRGTVAEVFRAPDINEVFGAPNLDAPSMSFDPCDGYTGNPVSLACANVPTDGSFINRDVQQNLQSSAITAGSRYAQFPIKPESGKTFDVGAVYSPSWMNGLSATVDFWHLYLNDIITTVRLQSVVDLCNAGQTVYCTVLHRIPSGPQQGQISPQTIEPTGNLGSINVAGVDASLTYRLPQTSFGSFNFRVDTTYLKRYNQNTAPGTAANTVYTDAGHYLNGGAQAAVCPGATSCLFPRFRGNGTVRWDLGDWDASWLVRYIGDFRVGSPAPSQDTHPVGSKLFGIYFDYPSTIYHDIRVGYNLKSLNTRFDLGIRNLFDRLPPYTETYDYISSANFDLIGRYYWARVTVSF